MITLSLSYETYDETHEFRFEKVPDENDVGV